MDNVLLYNYLQAHTRNFIHDAIQGEDLPAVIDLDEEVEELLSKGIFMIYRAIYGALFTFYQGEIPFLSAEEYQTKTLKHTENDEAVYVMSELALLTLLGIQHDEVRITSKAHFYVLDFMFNHLLDSNFKALYKLAPLMSERVIHEELPNKKTNIRAAAFDRQVEELFNIYL